jgi:hypothetical protein
VIFTSLPLAHNRRYKQLTPPKRLATNYVFCFGSDALKEK